MKINIRFAVFTACCLMLSANVNAAEFPESESEPVITRSVTAGEEATTHTLLRRILEEIIRANSLKEDKRCSDGGKSYSPGYIISVNKKTLRCDTARGYPEWVEGAAS